MLEKHTPSLKAGTKYLTVKKFSMTIHHPQIKGKGNKIIFPVGTVVTSTLLGNELTRIAYYSGHITDDFKLNEAGHVIHPEDKTEKKTAVWRKHFK